MEIWLLSFALLAIVLTIMAIGVILGGKEKSLRGSCGGLNKVMNQPGRPCDFCGRKDLCENEKEFTLRAQKKLDPLV